MAVTAKGVDYAFSHPSVDCLAQNGYTFACRYLYPMSQNPGTKNLTRDEAALLNARLKHGVVSNFESWASRALEGHDAGVDDARSAQAQHTACGGRMDRPIYFSVDFDAQPGQFPQIRAYFLGLASVIGVQRVGAYSGYGPIKWLFDQGLIAWGWQTYAWSGGRFDERCQLAQDKNGVPLCGGEVDLDTAHAADFGQWNSTTAEEDVTPEDIAAIAKAVWVQKITPNATAQDHLVSANNAAKSADTASKASAVLAADIKKAVANLPTSVPPLSPEQVDAAVKAMTVAVLAGQPASFTGHVELKPTPPA